jgi:hypothetical protein
MSDTKNRRVAERAAFDCGALSVAWENHRNHDIGLALMPSGVVARLTVSKGRSVDDYKIKGWTRQQINRAEKGIRT